MTKLTGRISLGLVFLFAAPLAHAGRSIASVNWEAASTSIPTVGGLGLVALALLLGVVGARILHQRGHSVRMLSLALITGGLLAGAQLAHTTIKLPPGIVITPDACAGGSKSYFGTDPESLINNCANAVRITAYEFDTSSLPSCYQLVETCPVGTLVEANGGSCTLNYYDSGGCIINE